MKVSVLHKRRYSKNASGQAERFVPLLRTKTAAVLCIAIIMGCSDPPSQSTTPAPVPTTNRLANDDLEPKQVTTTDHPWRTDPGFSGKFHPDYPDDLQVIVHEGGPRFTQSRPELVWVRVTGKRTVAYQGTLLNQPHQLPSLEVNASILFLPANVGNEPFMVTEKYLNERSNWHIRPCDKCGMPDLFDAPSDLQAKIFPNVPADAKMEAFTSFCPICGGVQVVSSGPMEDQMDK